MRRTTVVMAVLIGVGLAVAGVAYRAAAEQDAGHPAGKWGHRGMAAHHQMGFCSFMTTGTDIKVTPTKTGVTIEVSATDPTTIARIQKKAQILQLMHELRALGPEQPRDAHGQSSHEEEEEQEESAS